MRNFQENEHIEINYGDRKAYDAAAAQKHTQSLDVFAAVAIFKRAIVIYQIMI